MRGIRLLVWAFALVSAASAFGQQEPFSHKLHLTTVGLRCATCHASAAASDSSEDRNLPSEETCRACHNGETAPEIDVSWLAEETTGKRTYRFNHEFHLAMGNPAPVILQAIESGKYLGYHHYDKAALETDNACEACHRSLRETALAGKANLPQMPDCLVCHDQVDNPFSCGDCHFEGVDLKPADHTRDFVDLHSTGRLNYDKQTCLPCHGRNFACMGCH